MPTTSTMKNVATTTNSNNLNVETIDSMVTINSNNESFYNGRHQQQHKQQIHLRNNNNNNNNKNNNKIDVDIFTNTKELNQVNLNSTKLQSLPTASPAASLASSTTTLASRAQTSSSSSSSSSAAFPSLLSSSSMNSTEEKKIMSKCCCSTIKSTEIEAQKLIMSSTMKPMNITAASVATTTTTMMHNKRSTTTAAATAAAVNKLVFTSSSSSSASSSTLRKSQSTPAFKFGDSTTLALSASVNTTTSPMTTSSIDCAMEATNYMPNATGEQSSSKVKPTSEQHQQQRFGCAHYKRRAMFVTPCCNKFYKCRFCHDENESHHFDRKTLTELICSECNTRQKVQEQCEKCGVRFGKYTCLICNLFDDADKQQYHCHGCGICRIGGAHNFFHCEVCNMCLPIQLKIDGHRCVENISRSHCPVCLGDIHTSRIPCHIPDCGHLLHKMCFDQLLASGHYTCPTCQTSLIDMTALWEYLDDQASRMPVPLKYENQRVHIFCNDCHKTSKAKFHFIGLKCMYCGAYNTTQDVKRRMSLVKEEPSSA